MRNCAWKGSLDTMPEAILDCSLHVHRSDPSASEASKSIGLTALQQTYVADKFGNNGRCQRFCGQIRHRPRPPSRSGTEGKAKLFTDKKTGSFRKSGCGVSESRKRSIGAVVILITLVRAILRTRCAATECEQPAACIYYSYILSPLYSPKKQRLRPKEAYSSTGPLLLRHGKRPGSAPADFLL